ncbi:MAG TPA: carboxypeptidase-like regulatory domain-containing protein, partial [Aquabacterium sp.]|nr:carboxypeptidase-like regulatory domain-containing protein [Aquabacterium sp.]
MRTRVEMAAWVVVWGALWGGAGAVQAASFKGTVTAPDGRPVAGALVTVFNEAGDRKETVYTSLDGRYAIRTPFRGKLVVRARVHKFEDVRREVQAPDDLARVQDF